MTGAAAGPVLRVLDWNVRGLRDDVAALVETVVAARPHVLIVQESPKVFRWRSRCAELARRCGLVVVAGGGDACGNLVMVDIAVAVQAARTLRFPLVPGCQFRGAVIADCTLRGAPFRVVGTHLGLGAGERLAQAEALRSEVGDGPPVVLAGDLNEPPGPVWKALGPDLRDAAAVSGDETVTFSTASPRRRIDALLVGPGVDVERYAVLDSPAVRRASDHRPISAELRLPAPPR